jgi:LPXTG-motif cell wall-anchored protein
MKLQVSNKLKVTAATLVVGASFAFMASGASAQATNSCPPNAPIGDSCYSKAPVPPVTPVAPVDPNAVKPVVLVAPAQTPAAVTPAAATPAVVPATGVSPASGVAPAKTLPLTGSDVAGIMGIAGVSLALGSTLVVTSRRRRSVA